MKIAEGKAADRKRAKGQCLVYGCTEKGRKKKGSPKRGILCCHHEHESRKEKNPLKYWFGVLRRNARRRHKVFTITLDDFKEFCDKTGYLVKKGKNVGNMSIDRRIDDLGYIPGNLCILEHGANVRKKYTDYFMRQSFEHPEQYFYGDEETPVTPPQNTDDLPF